jgi:3-dehydroquinate dehydratase
METASSNQSASVFDQASYTHTHTHARTIQFSVECNRLTRVKNTVSNIFLLEFRQQRNISDTTKGIIAGFTLFQACVTNVIIYNLLRLGIAVSNDSVNV